MNGDWHEVELVLNGVLKQSIKFKAKESIQGGCINDVWKVTDTKNNKYFIKTNTTPHKKMFFYEAEALEEIASSSVIRVPKVLAHGSTASFSFLILEYIPLKSLVSQVKLGEQLGNMHKFIGSQMRSSFGWRYNNYLGTTPQPNSINKSWVYFWKMNRLQYQLDLAKTNGYAHAAYDDGLKLVESVGVFFTTYKPAPSLLHGDLWGGNCGGDVNSNPVIYDPALYYGDKETDIAMTELFGGFDNSFYDAYNACNALDSGYKTRKVLYNLYHILNHYNLFGGSYARQAEDMTRQLLSEF